MLSTLKRNVKDLRYNFRYNRAFHNTPWAQQLRTIQNELAVTGPHPNYAYSYRFMEPFFWRNIPGWIIQDAAASPRRRCLDIGCAYGTLMIFTKQITNCESFGLDFIDGYMNPRIQSKYNLNRKICNIELEPCPFPGPFDLIFLTEVIEHLNFNCIPTLRKIRDLLADNGRLYLSTPNSGDFGIVTKYVKHYSDLPEPAPRPPGQQPIDDHVWQFSLPELIDCTNAAGLKIVRFEYSQFKPGLRHLNLCLARNPAS